MADPLLRPKVVRLSAQMMMAVSGNTGEVVLNAFVTAFVQFLGAFGEGNRKKCEAGFRAFIQATEAHMKTQDWK
ncbi:MAG: hypothetical protein JWN75_1231 [Candidatus Saccharibacteria bacterium]|nr:hypothetical protein [Candidatus Saccharibacteria bacterium]